MNDEIIAEMGPLFRKGVFSKKTSFFFLVDDIAVTVTIDAESYSVELGPATGKADCSCKTSGEMFRKIWYDGYRPGIMDFLGGEIKTDAPFMLPQFLAAFGK
jgi:hypothetical protein